MNPIDVAKGYKKLLEMKGHPIERIAASGASEGISDLGRELGVSKDKISQYLNLLWEPGYVLESIKKDSSKFSSLNSFKLANNRA